MYFPLIHLSIGYWILAFGYWHKEIGEVITQPGMKITQYIAGPLLGKVFGRITSLQGQRLWHRTDAGTYWHRHRTDTSTCNVPAQHWYGTGTKPTPNWHHSRTAPELQCLWRCHIIGTGTIRRATLLGWSMPTSTYTALAQGHYNTTAAPYSHRHRLQHNVFGGATFLQGQHLSWGNVFCRETSSAGKCLPWGNVF